MIKKVGDEVTENPTGKANRARKLCLSVFCEMPSSRSLDVHKSSEGVRGGD
jgi:hypothetical protein